MNADTDTVYTSATTNLAYLFTSPGQYYVYLQSNNGHLSWMTKSIYVDSTKYTSAYFSFMHCSNHFINMSTCASAFHWNFGDGYTSTDAFPVHEYADTGHYTVKLTSYNGTDSAVYTKKIYVDCTHFPNPYFSYRVSYDTVFVHWLDDMPVPINSWLFSDTLTAHNVRDTFCVYPDTGRYDIVFILLTNCLYTGSDQWVHVVFPKQEFYFFPNPVASNGQLHVSVNSSLPDTLTGSIYNLLGEKIFTHTYYPTEGLNKYTVSTDNYASGVYVLLFESKRKRWKGKFIVGPG
jgi:PKD repeat protein